MQEEAVKQVLPCDRGILSIGARSVHLAERRGRNIWHLTYVLGPLLIHKQVANVFFSHPYFEDLRCVCLSPNSSTEAIAAGCQEQMFRVDLEKGQVSEVVCKHSYLVF